MNIQQLAKAEWTPVTFKVPPARMATEEEIDEFKKQDDPRELVEIKSIFTDLTTEEILRHYELDYRLGPTPEKDREERLLHITHAQEAVKKNKNWRLVGADLKSGTVRVLSRYDGHTGFMIPIEFLELKETRVQSLMKKLQV